MTDLKREDTGPTGTRSIVSERSVTGFVISQLFAIQYRCEQDIPSRQYITILVCNYYSLILELVENKKYTVLTGRLR